MHSDLISKIEKARQYASQPERIAIQAMTATFRGGNDDHLITVDAGVWHCDCAFFRGHGTCAHVMAIQKVLSPMLSEQARSAVNPLDDDAIVSNLA